MKSGKLVVISGPSAGAGKNTLLKMFLAKHPDWHSPPSTTTRQPRPGGADGKDMQFVDVPTFEQWQKEDKFLETDFHADAWYGTLKEPVERLIRAGKSIMFVKDVRGGLKLKQAIPETILVFLNAENWEALEKRFRARGTEDETAITRRLALAKTELTYQSQFDFRIINPTGHPEKALADLETALGY
jgi:guanylate kinase